MTYQRLAMGSVRRGSASNAEHKGDEKPDQLIRDQEEDRGCRYHDEHHQRGDHRFAPARPRDLLGLGSDLLQKLKRTDLCHPGTCGDVVCPQIGTRSPTAKNGTEWRFLFGSTFAAEVRLRAARDGAFSTARRCNRQGIE